MKKGTIKGDFIDNERVEGIPNNVLLDLVLKKYNLKSTVDHYVSSEWNSQNKKKIIIIISI